jgi:uncharacterized protein YbcI
VPATDAPSFAVIYSISQMDQERAATPSPRGRAGPSPGGTISTEIVSLLKASTGRGPTAARKHVHDDSVVVLMREGHTTAEASMAEGGHQRAVAQARVDLTESQRQRFIDVVEYATGRRVISF